MTFVEPRRITFRIRLDSTQVMLTQAFAHLDTAQLAFLGVRERPGFSGIYNGLASDQGGAVGGETSILQASQLGEESKTHGR